MWQIIVIVALCYFLLVNFDDQVKENFNKPGYTYYHDIYRRKLHRYPFDSYSLYGFDDPRLSPEHRLRKYRQPPFNQTIARLNTGYTGFPSYFFRHYYR